jgi:hypothetical protein
MGKEPPANMVPPDLDEDQEAMIASFWDLCRDRRYTPGGPAAIPWSSAHAYALHLGLGRYEDLYDDFLYAIGAMDALYLRLVSEEIKKEQQKAERASRSAKHRR